MKTSVKAKNGNGSTRKEWDSLELERLVDARIREEGKRSDARDDARIRAIIEDRVFDEGSGELVTIPVRLPLPFQDWRAITGFAISEGCSIDQYMANLLEDHVRTTWNDRDAKRRR